MNLNDLANLGQIIGAVAVVSLIYVSNETLEPTDSVAHLSMTEFYVVRRDANSHFLHCQYEALTSMRSKRESSIHDMNKEGCFRFCAKRLVWIR